jgi:acetylornithine deacetylase/succinyl-diaminopimelate desuccinylase-like protein
VRVARAVEALGRIRLPQHNTAIVEGFLRKLAEHASFPQKQAILLLLEPRASGTVLDLLARRDVGEAAAMGAMLRNTASPTGLTAGKKINVIPSSARAQIDGRIIPGQSVESYLAEVRRVVGDDVKVTVLESRDGSVFNADTPLFRAICSTLERHHPGSIPVPFMIPGFTDSSAYRALGATCYGFSPVKMPAGLSFPALYHADDERIPVAGFAWGLRVLYDLVRRFCGEGDTL